MQDARLSCHECQLSLGTEDDFCWNGSGAESQGSDLTLATTWIVRLGFGSCLPVYKTGDPQSQLLGWRADVGSQLH